MGETGLGSASQFQYKNYREDSSRTHIQNTGEVSYMSALLLCAFLGSHFWPMPERGHWVTEASGYSSRHHTPYKLYSLWLLGKTLRISLVFGNVESLTHVKLQSAAVGLSLFRSMFPLSLSESFHISPPSVEEALAGRHGEHTGNWSAPCSHSLCLLGSFAGYLNQWELQLPQQW